MYQNLFDSHIHSENSHDGSCPVSILVQTALAKGLRGIAITDHCDAEKWEPGKAEEERQKSIADTVEARQQFGDRILLSAGVELGQPQRNPQLSRQMMDGDAYDFILMSHHIMEGLEDFYVIRYDQLSPAETHALLLRYLEELLEMCKSWNFDSLAHLTLQARYSKMFFGIDIDFTRYTEQLDAILRVLVERGKALEVNTSGLRTPLADTLPPLWTLRRFRELGGELVTVGSDAHTAADLGVGIQQGMERLAAAGFTHFAFYQQRKPIMQRIF